MNAKQIHVTQLLYVKTLSVDLVVYAHKEWLVKV